MVLYAAREGQRGVLYAVSADGRVRQRPVLADGDVREPAWGQFRSQRCRSLHTLTTKLYRPIRNTPSTHRIRREESNLPRGVQGWMSVVTGKGVLVGECTG